MVTHLDNSKLINLKGTSSVPILICNELCRMKTEYYDNTGMILSNLNGALKIDYNLKSFINYNGGESFGAESTKYFLKEIQVIGPSRHLIDDTKYPIEIIMTHQPKDGNRQLHLSVLLEPSDRNEARMTASWKLFQKFAEQLPKKNESSKKVQGLVSWNAEHLLPSIINQSFFSYSTNNKNHYVVFEEPIKVPTSFYRNFVKKIVGQQKYDTLNEIPIPQTAPEEISAIFFKRNVIEDPETVREKKDDIKYESCQEILEKKPLPIDKEEPKTISNNTEDENKDNKDKKVDEKVCKEDCPQEISWWKQLLSYLAAYIILGFIVMGIQIFLENDDFRYNITGLMNKAKISFYWTGLIILSLFIIIRGGYSIKYIKDCPSQTTYGTGLWIVMSILTIIGLIALAINKYKNIQFNTIPTQVPAAEPRTPPSDYVELLSRPLQYILKDEEGERVGSREQAAQRNVQGFFNNNEEQPPVEQPPVEQPPAEQPPVEQAPVEQPPVQQAPVEQAPVEQLEEIKNDGQQNNENQRLPWNAMNNNFPEQYNDANSGKVQPFEMNEYQDPNIQLEEPPKDLNPNNKASEYQSIPPEPKVQGYKPVPNRGSEYGTIKLKEEQEPNSNLGDTEIGKIRTPQKEFNNLEKAYQTFPNQKNINQNKNQNKNKVPEPKFENVFKENKSNGTSLSQRPKAESVETKINRTNAKMNTNIKSNDESNINQLQSKEKKEPVKMPKTNRKKPSPSKGITAENLKKNNNQGVLIDPKSGRPYPEYLKEGEGELQYNSNNNQPPPIPNEPEPQIPNNVNMSLENLEKAKASFEKELNKAPNNNKNYIRNQLKRLQEQIDQKTQSNESESKINNLLSKLPQAPTTDITENKMKTWNSIHSNLNKIRPKLVKDIEVHQSALKMSKSNSRKKELEEKIKQKQSELKSIDEGIKTYLQIKRGTK